MTDIREELMPRSNCLFRFCTLAALFALASPAPAQDAATVATAAEKQREEIQKKLAAGKLFSAKDDPDQKQVNPDQQRLRIDGFKKAGDAVQVTGAFLDPGTKADAKTGRSPEFNRVEDELKKFLNAGTVEFTWELIEVGASDKDGKAKNDTPRPHVVLQNAANAAGATRSEADHVYATGSAFGPGGELVLTGFRDAAPVVEQWLTGDGAKALATHPAAGTKKVTFALAKLDKWPLAVAEVRKSLSASKDVAFRRFRADRVYLFYEGSGAKLNLTGVRLEGGKFDEDALEKAIKLLWTEVPEGFGKNIEGPLDDPYKELRAAVANRPALDGLRVDLGAEFGPGGEFRLAGLRPELTPEQKKELNDVYQTVLKALVAKGGASDRYKLLATSPASADGMRLIPINELKAALRSWVIRYRDDVRFRLYFIDDVKSIAHKRQFGEGLVLVYQTANPADGPALDAKYTELFGKFFPKGLPGVQLSKPDNKPTEPLLPGLTAELRSLAANDKAWYGVFIGRGYFDDDGRYTLAGAVDSEGQNEKLHDHLKKLAGDEKWKKTYFTSETGELLLPPKAPKLAVIPMSEMLTRVKRVAPAYPVFDGVRVESAKYNDKGYLIFQAHTVVPLDKDMQAQLTELFADPKSPYRQRVLETDPAEPVIKIEKAAGPPAPHEQVGHFSVGYGARLLAEGELVKAKAWLDAGLLHYSNVSGVWFLSAYYNHLHGDMELVERDLKRVIDLEGRLAFDGPRQRRTRYEWAKDLQGPKRITLERFWLERFRDVNDGAKPITLTPPGK